jgi:hypothetical protein
MDKEQICAEMDRVSRDFRELLDTATVAELRKPTDGTKWNNEQLLFHMLFGHLLVRNLRFLVWGFSRIPGEASTASTDDSLRTGQIPSTRPSPPGATRTRWPHELERH